MSLSRHIRLFRPLAVLLALSVAVFSCKEPVKIEPAVPPVLTVMTQTVEGEAGSQFITISGTGPFPLRLLGLPSILPAAQGTTTWSS